jgi:hypothetical protein
MTHWKRTVIEPHTHDTRRRVIYVTGNATAVCARADLRTIRVKTIVDRIGARAVLYAWCEVGDFTSLNRFVESILPSLRHLTRIRSPGRIRGSPGRATYLGKARRGRCTLTPEKGMASVIVVLIPTIGKNASSDVVMDNGMDTIFTRRDDAAVDGGGKGEDGHDDDRDDARTSKRGEHDAGGRLRAREP